MPLIEPDPPSTRPRGTGMRRPSMPGCGSVAKRQLRWLVPIAAATAAGTLMKGWLSRPPASSRHTVRFASSDRRAASAAPAVPPPTTMTSKLSASVPIDSPCPATRPARLAACEAGLPDRESATPGLAFPIIFHD